jgi:hypothetical protein
MDADSSGGTTKIPICGPDMMNYPGFRLVQRTDAEHMSLACVPAYQGI